MNISTIIDSVWLWDGKYRHMGARKKDHPEKIYQRLIEELLFGNIEDIEMFGDSYDQK